MQVNRQTARRSVITATSGYEADRGEQGQHTQTTISARSKYRGPSIILSGQAQSSRPLYGSYLLEVPAT
jgi:hypothetical protein